MTLLGFVGDVVVDRDDPESAFATVADVLAAPDAMFGNCEAPFTTEPHFALTVGVAFAPHPDGTRAFRHFDVMSTANNHIVDAGHAAMLETMDHLRAVGVAPVGSGRDIDEARAPAILERNGLRIGYHAYASVFPFGYEARRGWPGVAPVRGINLHVEGMPNYWLPGVIGSIMSVPVQEDYDALAEDLRKTRDVCDVVVASFHWGDFQEPYILTDHEVRTARFAIDHGADIVVGHHHHTLRGVDWYRGKPIFYGLGNFVAEIRNAIAPDWWTSIAREDRYELSTQPGFEGLSNLAHMDITMLAWVTLDESGLPSAAGFLPATAAPDRSMQAHDARSKEGQRVIDYVRTCCDVANLDVTVRVADEHTICGLAPAGFLPGS